MPRERPTAGTVFGILNIVFGGIGIVGSLCAIGGVFFVVGLAQQPGNQPEMREMKELIRIVQEELPWLVTYFVVSMALSIVLSVILIVSGIGLLMVQNWGRALAITYAICGIIVGLGDTVFSFAVVNPGVEQVEKKLVGKLAANLPPAKQQDFQKEIQNPFRRAGGVVGQLVGFVISLIYPSILLIFMFTPTVRNAYSGRRPAGEWAEHESYEPREYTEGPPPGYEDRY